jgi:hypothetical protein
MQGPGIAFTQRDTHTRTETHKHTNTQTHAHKNTVPASVCVYPVCVSLCPCVSVCLCNGLTCNRVPDALRDDIDALLADPFRAALASGEADTKPAMHD